MVNSIVGAILDLALSPLRDQSPLLGLILVAAVSTVVMLLIVRATSNQARLAAVKRSIQACVYEVRLFGDDAGAILRALGGLLRHNLTYLRLSFVPMVWMAVPFGLLMVQMDAIYGVAEVAPGRATLVKVVLRDPARPTPVLSASAGVRVETPAVWIPSLREAVWRVSAETAGEYELTVVAGGTAATKRFSTAGGNVRRSPVRPDGRVLDQLLHPVERPLPAGSPFESITVNYPSRGIAVFGWEVHWLIVFLVLSLIFAMALRSRLGVVL